MNVTKSEGDKMEVVVLKLVSGEELLASKIDGKYSKVRTLQFMQGDDGHPRAGLAPWVYSNPDVEMTINPNTIAAEVPAQYDLEKSYLRSVSGIELATSI
jgi:hypothetical protein